MIKRLVKRKGISTFIATLLLMVLAVAAGIVIYAYTMGYLGGFGGTEQLGSMSLDNAKLMNDTTVSPNILYLSAYVRNTGKVSLNITTAYIDGTKVDLTTPVILSEGVVKEVRIDQGSGPGDYPWATGHTYTVKLICKDNTQLSFSIKG